MIDDELMDFSSFLGGQSADEDVEDGSAIFDGNQMHIEVGSSSGEYLRLVGSPKTVLGHLAEAIRIARESGLMATEKNGGGERNEIAN